MLKVEKRGRVRFKMVSFSGLVVIEMKRVLMIM